MIRFTLIMTGVKLLYYMRRPKHLPESSGLSLITLGIFRDIGLRAKMPVWGLPNLRYMLSTRENSIRLYFLWRSKFSSLLCREPSTRSITLVHAIVRVNRITDFPPASGYSKLQPRMLVILRLDQSNAKSVESPIWAISTDLGLHWPRLEITSADWLI